MSKVPWHKKRFCEYNGEFKRYGWGTPENAGFWGWFLLTAFFAAMVLLLLSHY